MEIVLTITMKPDGQVAVSGPIANKSLCYGMLECAKDAIRSFEPTKIQLPTPGNGR